MHNISLVLSLEKEGLQAVRAELLSRYEQRTGKKDKKANKPAALTSSASSTNVIFGETAALSNLGTTLETTTTCTEADLTAVEFVDFVLALLLNMNILPFEKKSEFQHYTFSNGFFLQMVSIISVFDAVDVDSRGAISFIDFTNFCLRLGRLIFKPNVKRSMTTYLQYQDQKNLTFPSYKMKFMPHSQLLLVFDSDTPRVRIYGREGKYYGKVNPVQEARKSLRVKAAAAKLTYNDRTNIDKDAIAMRNADRELDGGKGFILDCAYMDSSKHMAFSCTQSYLIWVDATNGLSAENDVLNIIGHVKTEYPLYGLHYSKVLDILIAYPGEGSEHNFEIYDPKSKKLRFQVSKHTSKILSICEVILDKVHPQKDHYLVTSSIDKKVIMWPTAPISALLRKHDAKKMLRVADVVDFELRGHVHAIQSLVYANVQEMIFGCGFDFDIIGWDPFSRDVCMRFVGHFKSMAGLQIVYVPNEKLLSIDVSGVMKLWNISKELGVYGEQDSSVTLQCTQPANIKDFTRTYERGKGVAVLAEKVYFFNVEGDVMDDIKPVQSGLGICWSSARMLTVYRSSIQIFNILNCRKVKRVGFLDPDLISTADQIVSKNDDLKMGAIIKPSKVNAAPDNPHINVQAVGGIDIKDKISAVAFDSKCKKIFFGTNDGRVLLYDSFTFGLLKQLTAEDEDSSFRQQGAVVGLNYVDRDELLVAVYATGVVKVFGGCVHGGYMAAKATQQHVDPRLASETAHANIGDYPHAKGGRAPSKPYLLRECDIGAITDLSVRDIAVSTTHNLIAVLTKFGLVYLYDYLTLEFLQCIAIEDETAEKSTPVMYLSITFVPHAPIILVVNNLQRVIAWAVRTLGYRHLLSWHILDDLHYNSLDEHCKKFYEGYPLETIDKWIVKTNEEQEVKEDKSEMTEAEKKAAAEKRRLEADPNRPPVWQPNFQSNFTSVKCYCFPPAGMVPSKTHQVNSHYNWLLIMANDDGQLYTLNISQLVIQSGALECIPKFDGNIAVYQKIKPKRYYLSVDIEYDSNYQRLKLPEDWDNKLANPLRKEVTPDPATDFGSSSSFLLSTAKVTAFQLDSESTVAIPSSAFKLTRAQTRRNLRSSTQKPKRAKLELPVETYVQGLYAWVAYSRVGVRGIDFYNPNLNMETDSFVPINEGSFETYPHRDQLPLLVTMSEFGSIRLWTFGGVYLGQTLDDGSEEEDIDKQNAIDRDPNYDFLQDIVGVINDEEELKKREEERMKREGKSAGDDSDMVASTTFVTSIESDNLVAGEAAYASKVFVKSESRSALTTRRLSLIPKTVLAANGKVNAANAVGLNASTPTSSRKNSNFFSSSSHLLLTKPSYQNAAIDFMKLTKKVYGTKGWLLPMVTMHLPPVRKDAVDAVPIRTPAQFTATQYSYFMLITNWVLPQIQQQVNESFRQRLGLTDIANDVELKKQMFQRKMSTFHDSIIAKHIPESDTRAASKPRKIELSQASTEASRLLQEEHDQDPERFLDKIIGAMSNQELTLIDTMREQCKTKFAKKNMHQLIEYIQQSDAFSPEVRDGHSVSLLFKNYESEKVRRERNFTRELSEDLQEYLNQIKDEGKRPNKGSKKASSRPSSSLKASISTGSIMKLDINFPDLNISTPMEGSNTNLSGMNDSSVIAIPNLSAIALDPEDCSSSVVHSRVSPEPAVDGKDAALMQSINELQISTSPDTRKLRPQTAPVSRMGTLAEDVPLSHTYRNQMSPSTSPIRPRTASAATSNNQEAISGSIRPKSAQMLRVHTVDNLHKSNQELDEDEMNKTMKSSKSMVKINHIIEDISHLTDKKPKFITISSMQELMERPASAPPNMSSKFATKEEGFFLKTSDSVSLLGSATHLQDSFTNFDRLDTISTHFEQVVVSSNDQVKAKPQSFRLFDPLHKKKMLQLQKDRKRMLQKQTFAKDKDRYLEEDDYHNQFEDVVDIDREAKKLHGKTLLRQAQAIGSRSSFYGPYRNVDLLKFIHFLDLLPVAELSHQERSQMIYLDEHGIVDYTRYLKDQPFYMVNDILDVVRELMSEYHPLYPALILFRDESPKLFRISLFQLIAYVFKMSKPLGIQLRIFMYLTATHMIYDLMKSAVPPKEFKNNLKAKSSTHKVDAISNDAQEYATKDMKSNLKKEMDGRTSPTSQGLQRKLSVSFVGQQQPLVSDDDHVAADSPQPHASKLKSSLQASIETDKEMNEARPASPLAHSPSRARTTSSDMTMNSIAVGGSRRTSTVSTNTAFSKDSNGNSRQQIATNALPPPSVLVMMALPEEGKIEEFESEAEKALHARLSQCIGRFIVKPHPTRGFYNWVIRRKMFAKLGKIFDMWCDENLECLNIQDFIEIFYTMMPKADLENYRIMKALPLMVNRLGLKMVHELNSEHLTRIFENALQMKIVSG